MKLFLRILSLFIEPLVIPAVLLAGSVYFLGETSIGLQTSFKIINKLIPGELSVQHAQGKLFSQFTLNNISYHGPSGDATIQFLEFQWHPKKLLEGKLYIKHLLAHDIIITQKINAQDKPFDLNKIHFYLQHVRASQVQISHVAYTTNDSAFFEVLEMDLQQTGAENYTFSAKLPNGGIQGTLADQWNARWHFELCDLGTVIPQSHGVLTLSGTITGARLSPSIMADLNGEKLAFNDDKIDHLAGKVNLIVKPDNESTALLTASGIKIQNHVFQDTAININGKTHVSPENRTTTLMIALNKKPTLNIVLTLPKSFDITHYAEQPLSVKVKADSVNLQTLAHYVPNVKNLQGSLIGSLVLQGPLKTPRFNSEISLNNASVTIPEIGVTFKNINLHAIGGENRRLNYSGSLQAGNGHATLKGSTDFSRNDFPSTISLQGTNLQLLNLEEYKIYASPDLDITVANNIVAIHGKIFIPDAKIAPKNFNGVVTLPSDVVFVGEKKPNASSSLLEYLPSLQVSVTLGDKIYLHYQDIEATLKGNVVISKEPNTPATGVGELYATKGTYNAYKKLLTITEGRLVYTGNLITDPGLNIKASREMKTSQTGTVSEFTNNQGYTGSENLTVGVQVLGTLDKPTISLYSVPAMSQMDVLSYLVLGVPSSQASTNTHQALLSAASALTLGSSGSTNLGKLMQNIQDRFGLSGLDVQSVQSIDQNTGEAIAGKTSFVVRLRYKLSKRFSIQSETSTIDTGADLLYSIERG